ncbi:MAG TPA: S-adenosylmethionine:tRNA ribosyltransferase-isomerase [Polyangiaceae bacterium]
MKPATWPRDTPLSERLLRVDPTGGRWTHHVVGDLPDLLRPGDLVIANDAATIPASLFGSTTVGERLEVRLATTSDESTWQAVLFGEGDWHTRTEDRAAPPPVVPGDTLQLGDGLDATIVAVDARSPRLVTLRFSLEGAALWTALHRYGRPVQYAYVRDWLATWHVQTAFASRPWAVEMPSAGRPITASLLASLRRSGVAIARLTHAAGLSSTGDPAIDHVLPFPERYEIPRETASALARARAEGKRIVAVGTTVVRALEGCASEHAGEVVPGRGTTDLHIGEGFVPRVVDGLLTGLHEEGTSHRGLLHAFASEPLLAGAWADAEARGYLAHEFGDHALVLRAA